MTMIDFQLSIKPITCIASLIVMNVIQADVNVQHVPLHSPASGYPKDLHHTGLYGFNDTTCFGTYNSFVMLNLMEGLQK